MDEADVTNLRGFALSKVEYGALLTLGIALCQKLNDGILERLFNTKTC